MQPAPAATTYAPTGVPTGPGGSGPGGPAGSVIYVPVISSPAASTNFYDRYRHRQSVILGVGLLLIGILCIIFNAVGMAFALSGMTEILGNGYGYWSGVLFIITGSLGISAGMKKTRCQIIGFMVTCIFSAICAGPLLAMGIVGTLVTNPPSTYSCIYQFTNYQSCDDQTSDMGKYRMVIAMQALLAIFGFIAAVFAIWGSAICCQAVCCCTPQPQSVMIPANYFANDGQVLYINQPQGLPYSYTQPPATNLWPQGHMPPPAYQANYVQPTWNSSSQPTWNSSSQPTWNSTPQPMPPLSTISPSAPVFDGLHPPPYPSNGQSTETGKY